MSELFDIPESLSPKLKWLRAHGLETIYDHELDACEESPETGEICYPWVCFAEDDDYNRIGRGPTEEDAIWSYCHKNNLPHYSVSEFSKAKPDSLY